MSPTDTAGSISPSAQLDTVAMLREDLEAERHPADGGGRAWLEDEDAARATARTPGRFPVIFEAGPLGVAEGGVIFLLASPFWGWSAPQTEAPEAYGFTTVATSAAGVTLTPEGIDGSLLAVRVGGGALAPGERVEVIYGAGPAGALADRFAERRERLWVAVDGDGDGVRQVLADSPTIDVGPGPPAQMVVTLPSVARPGETVRLTVAILDAWANAWVDVEGEVRLESSREGLVVPDNVALPRELGGCTSVELTVREQGTFRVRAVGPGGLAADSNPMVVTDHGPRVLWGDLHGHSQLSDGTGTPEDWFRYARDVAGLDVAALTDHDHWGIRFLDQTPDWWEEIKQQVRLFHRPGEFVTLLGFEWTSWLYGHRHVLYFTDDGEVLSSVDPRYDEPEELWQALRGRPAITVAHHTAGGPVATDWERPPDPVLEPVTEVCSVHGQSEASDAPAAIYSAVQGNFARDALERGYGLGFVGSGDGHDGHPGLTRLGSGLGGLAAIISEQRTREGVLAALRARRVYATNGPRIVLRFALAGRPMGADLEVGEQGLAEADLVVTAVAEAPVERIDIVRSGAVVQSVPGEGLLELALHASLADLRPGEYVYVRVLQENGGMAWSSPVFTRSNGE